MYIISKSVNYGRIGDETMITDSLNNIMIRLDETGTELWELIYDGWTIEKIKDFFCGKYPHQKDEINADIDTFFRDLIKQGILEEKML